jgi:glycosyltransferase involved in cell wall biosynthesis
MSNEHPRVSIGMPVYNGENYLEETLNSIVAQTFEDFELIISDNASTDRTEEICKAYAAEDRRIRYYRNEQNLGPARNYNRVFELAKGEYFKWTAHDDLLAPEYLERCVEVLDRNPALVLCYSRVIFVDEQQQQLRKSCSDLLNLSSPQPHQRFKHYQELLFKKKKKGSSKSPTKADKTDKHPGGDRWLPIFGVIRTEALSKTPLIASYVNSDMILLGELALLGEFYEIPDYLFFYRDHDQASGRKNNGWYEFNVWFDPNNKGKKKMVLPLWKWFAEYLSAIKRAQLPWQEKIACYLLMVRWLRVMRPRLVKELAINLAIALNIQTFSFLGYRKKIPTQW